MRNLIQPFAAATALVITAPAVAQLPVDDLRVRQLESEVLRLQRQLDEQARRIQLLEQAGRMATPIPAPSLSAPAPAPLVENTSPAWLVPSSWDRIKPGMTTLQVIAVLGRPTSARDAEGGKGRLFFYAMELAPGALLGGSIRLDDSGVVEINRPVLK